MPSDKDFRGYVENVDYLFERLPISRSFNEILKRIFRLQPFERISLFELREEILKLDTFYEYDAELRYVSKYAREGTHDHTRSTHLISEQVVADTRKWCSEPSDFYSDGSSPYLKRAPLELLHLLDVRSMSWETLPSCSIRSVSSRLESVGNITSDTHAHKPVTDLYEDELKVACITFILSLKWWSFFLSGAVNSFSEAEQDLLNRFSLDLILAFFVFNR